MFETLPTAPPAAELAVPPEALAAFAAFRERLAGTGAMVWGEHCTECAYPRCYETCAFYTPRADLHCRRFEAGFEPVRVAGAPTALRRIRFRRWGKLEAQGAVAIEPLAGADARERTDRRVAEALSRTPIPYAVKRKLAYRWNQRKQDQAHLAGALTADAFVVEAWAPDGEIGVYTLTLLNPAGGSGRLFQRRFEAGPHYQRLEVPVGEIAALVDLEAPFLAQIEPIGEAAGRELVLGVCGFVSLKAAAAPSRPAVSAPVKVVVWDLDETLWNGVLVEDGPEGVRLRPEAARAVKALDERGVLQSIASKNDDAEAMAALAAMGLADYFLHPQIGWGPKSQSIAAIAAALDLGLDSFVFIDDQPFERAEVGERHPMVRRLAHTDVADLLSRPEFDLPVTPESRQRRGLYRAEAARTRAFESAGDDYLRFLRESDIAIDVAPLSAADLERVFELSQRTNQLNFRGTKFTREDVSALLQAAPGRLGLTVRCADRFGDYGLIGFVVVDLAGGVIEEAFMSCRVQRKRVEHALFGWIAGELAARGVPALAVRHRPSPRNGAARTMLQELGFAEAASEGPDGLWTRPARLAFADGEVVRVKARVLAQAA